MGVALDSIIENQTVIGEDSGGVSCNAFQDLYPGLTPTHTRCNCKIYMISCFFGSPQGLKQLQGLEALFIS